MAGYLKHIQKLGNRVAFGRRVEYLKYNYSLPLKNLNSSQRVLEIGPGAGELLKILNDKGFTNIDIIDNDESVLKYCQKKYRINKTIFSKNLDLSTALKGSYDLIVLTQVFEHIPKSSYQNWIRCMYHSLNSDGQIIITVPNGANPLSGTERYGDLQHENMFTVFAFQELMTFADLKNSKYKIQGFEIPPISPINIIRIVLQKILHFIFLILMIINGAIYQKLLTPNITLLIQKVNQKV